MTDPVSLPSDRIKDAAEFETVGLDLVGPLYVSNGMIRGAYNELIDIDWNEVSRYVEIQRITWKFIPPTAAWFGGFWERLVRTVKELLRRTLGKAIFTYEELLTILCECEKVVNSRPLTYLPENMQDLTPITPASGNDITNPPLQKVQQTDSSVSCPNPDTLKATEQPQVTRCGRPVKKPDKLNLLTLTDVFD
ncbi:integrase catalytic domain-containing protein [Trichonephila clavipes]|nr:integrase catalytic domain-containing protein [Trichonephila clavipes]